MINGTADALRRIITAAAVAGSQGPQTRVRHAAGRSPHPVSPWRSLKCRSETDGCRQEQTLKSCLAVVVSVLGVDFEQPIPERETEIRRDVRGEPGSDLPYEPAIAPKGRTSRNPALKFEIVQKRNTTSRPQ